MAPERWVTVASLFEEAVELGPEERSELLVACADEDQTVANEVEKLLRAYDLAPGFLEQPAVSGLGPSAGGREGLFGELSFDSAFNSALDDAANEESGLKLAFATPQRVGRFRILSSLGEGGMSQVFLGCRDDADYRQLVAIKLMKVSALDREGVRRFEMERQVLATLAHDNIARILDGGRLDDGRPFLVMEYVEGQPIDEHCDSERLTIEDRLHLFCRVCEAVQFAHQNLVVHRDIKPSNILVNRQGSPKLLDFGIAKLLKPEDLELPAEQTAPGVRPMTPSFASPEQVNGDRVSTATDVYSLGVLLYRLLAGCLPYRGPLETRRDLENAVVFDAPQRLRQAVLGQAEEVSEGQHETRLQVLARARGRSEAQFLRRLDRELDAIVHTSLAKKPSERYASVDALVEDVRRHLAGLAVLAYRSSFLHLSRKFVRRNWLSVSVASAFAGLLVLSTVVLGVQAKRIAEQKIEVEQQRDRAEETARFLEDLFDYSSPESSLGETLTAREILDRGRHKVGAALSDQPLTKASLLETMGRVYMNLGMYAESETALEEALLLRRGVGEPGSVEMAPAEAALGQVFRVTGDFERARELLESALRRRELAYGDNHPLVARSAADLAELHHALSNFDASESGYRRALEILRKGHEDEVATDLADLQARFAKLQRDRGELAEAEALQRSVLALRRSQHGEEHPLVSDSLSELAVVVGLSGNRKEAGELLLQVLEVDQRTLPDGHPKLGVSYHNVGRVFEDQMDYPQARYYYQLALANLVQAHGEVHPDVGYLQTTLGFLSLRASDAEAAERHFRTALAIRGQTLPEGHIETAVTSRGLGTTLVELGRAREAEPYLRKALKDLEEGLPKNHSRVADAASHLGWCLALLGQHEEASERLSFGWLSHLEHRGEEHPRTVSAQERLERFERSRKP